MRNGARVLLAGVAVALSVPALNVPALAAAADKPVPYFASIAAGKARMRSGPGRTYPASWLYQRADLPVKIVAVFEKGRWYKVEDPDGTQGWILGALISQTRTALVTGGVAELRDAPQIGGRVTWRAAPGVVGRVSKCALGWCYFDVKGRGGFVETRSLWGVAGDERL
ncbi:SH3 domain-containing protein [Sphingomonas qilianensis]|uniref:SH3 domain-containing protein n=1 Tax=Sphingomonas qilianensis TaxID=1736690 RepID=A0ABU9XNS5_9SPHN